MSFEILYTKAAVKDIPKLKEAGLDAKALALIEILKSNPFKNPPSYEKLTGNLSGAYSRRINIKHRLIYQVYMKEQTVKILSMWVISQKKNTFLR